MQPEKVTSSDTKTSTLIATAKTFLSVFTTLDPTQVEHVQSENYKQEWAPASANGPAPINREEFASDVKKLGELLQGFPVRIKEMWPNPSLNQVTVWADSELVFHEHIKNSSDDPDEWTFHGEYIFIMTMDESGEKIERVFEFVDSKGTDRLREVLTKARKKLEELSTAG